jgi:hypothetical protein
MCEIYFHELSRRISEYIAESEETLDIFSPFITVNALKDIISGIKNGVQVNVVTRWKIIDFIMGSASLDLFDFCSSSGMTLYINPKLHLKTIVNDYHSVMLGSANITGRGLGLSHPANHEVFTRFKTPPGNYLLFLEQVKLESSLVTPSVVKLFEEEIKKAECLKSFDTSGFSERDRTLHEKARSRDFFLTSELPMCASLDQLYQVIKDPNVDFDLEVLSTARHDIVKYSLLSKSYESEMEFREYLTQQFFSHPFIKALCNFIDRPRRFGEIRAWVQSVCTDVPVPKRRSLSDNINVMYEWLVILGEGKFRTFRPNHTVFIAPIEESNL